MNTNAEKYVQELLLPFADEKYKEFNVRILATVPAERVMGVRAPHQRQVAKEVFKSEYKDAFYASLPHQTFEEYQVHGLLIEQEKDKERVIALLDEFLPFVDNWETCDTMSPKVFKKSPPDFTTIRRWISSKDTYVCRFGVGTLMGHYLEDRFSEDVLDMVVGIHSDEYYINMMRAWFFATALAKQYDRTLPYIEKHVLDTWTHNKSIQKARESFRVSPEQKEYLNSLKDLQSK